VTKQFRFHSWLMWILLAPEQSADFKAGMYGDLAEVDDDEIEAMLLNDEEVAIKTRVWYEFNKDYLEEMRIKREKEIMDRKNGVYKRTGTVWLRIME
jgi:hypothetical protein